MRRAVAGPDCMSSHDPPPRAICSDSLCAEWLEKWSLEKLCNSDHAHGKHYWSSSVEPGTWSCPGRPYCDPRHMEPS
jgi:hypothetical protein